MPTHDFYKSLRALCLDENAYQDLLARLREEDINAAQYRAMIDNQADLLCRYHPSTQVIFANQAYLRYIGNTYDEVVGQSFLKYLNVEQAEFAEAHIANLLKEKERITHEMRVSQGAMEGHWILWTDTPILDTDGNVIEILAVGRDISSRKEMELALKEREAQLNLVMDSVQNVLIAGFDLNLHYTLLRGHLLEIMGYGSKRLIGTSLLDKMPHSVQEIVRQHCARVLAGATEEIEYQSGSRYLHVRSYPLMSGDMIIGGVSMISDVTEHKQLELKKLEKSIENQRYEILSQFISNAAHEFYTPLSVIETSLHLAENAPDEERRKRALEKIHKHTERLTNLVDGMTTMMRLSSPTMGSRAPIHFHILFNDLLEDLEKAIASKRIKLDLHISETLPRFIGVAIDLRAAFKHILDNSIRHSPEDGLITVRIEAHEKSILVHIHDNGEGIPKEDLDKIFELFYRGDSAHTTPGLGLGLSIARTIIEKQHDGQISIESDLRQGTNVIVHLPVYF